MAADPGQPLEKAWPDLNLAALFETDSAKLPERIAEAEHALSLRDRKLWYSAGDHSGEKLALTGAMRALQALRNRHQWPGPPLSPCIREDGKGNSVVGIVAWHRIQADSLACTVVPTFGESPASQSGYSDLSSGRC